MNCLYNGVELPALPEWDKAAYPYAVIAVGETSAVLMCRAIAPTIGTFNALAIIFSSGEGQTFTATDGEWVSFDGYIANTYADWTNTDILNEDGSIFLAASEPVPVGADPIDPTALLVGYRVGQLIRGIR